MKKLVVITLSIIMVFTLCSCSSDAITFNADYSQLYFNGYTYVDLQNHNGKYRIDRDNAEITQIAKMPRGILVLFGGYTAYYGNDPEKPDFIANSQTTDVYLREDLCLDHSTTLTLQHDGEPFSFTIAESTTGEVVEYAVNEDQSFAKLLEFTVTVEPYSSVTMNISIVKKDGLMFLQDCWNSNYYIITTEFYDALTQTLLAQ